MDSGPRPRRPIKVVAMVVVYWIVGNLLSSVFNGLLERAGLVSAESAEYPGLILAWGLLFVLSLYFREPLDRWLRA